MFQNTFSPKKKGGGGGGGEEHVSKHSHNIHKFRWIESNGCFRFDSAKTRRCVYWGILPFIGETRNRDDIHIEITRP